MFLDYFALFLLLFVFVIVVYMVLWLHDIPYEIAKKRGHPHLDAIHIGGWVSLFTLHAIWPFLWIWAYMYRPGEGYGVRAAGGEGELVALRDSVRGLNARVAALEGKDAREGA